VNKKKTRLVKASFNIAGEFMIQMLLKMTERMVVAFHQALGWRGKV
jgi:hypothetical protein